PSVNIILPSILCTVFIIYPQIPSPIFGSCFLERRMVHGLLYEQHSDKGTATISKHGMVVNKESTMSKRLRSTSRFIYKFAVLFNSANIARSEITSSPVICLSFDRIIETASLFVISFVF